MHKQTLLIIPAYLQSQCNAICEQIHLHAANTFSAEYEDDKADLYYIACWDMLDKHSELWDQLVLSELTADEQKDVEKLVKVKVVVDEKTEFAGSPTDKLKEKKFKEKDKDK